MLDEIYRGVRFCGFLQLLHFASRTVQMEGLVSLQLFLSLKSFLRPKPTCQPSCKRSSHDPEKPVLCSHSQPTICPWGMLLGFVPALAVLPCWGIAGSLQLLDVMEDVFQVLVTADKVWWASENKNQQNSLEVVFWFFFFFACFLNLLRKLTDLPFTANLWLSAVFVRGSVTGWPPYLTASSVLERKHKIIGSNQNTEDVKYSIKRIKNPSFATILQLSLVILQMIETSSHIGRISVSTIQFHCLLFKDLLFNLVI